MKDCKYLLPCGDCDKYNIKCRANKEECDHDWTLWSTLHSGFTNINNTKIYICRKCGKKDMRDEE